jgi:5-methylcytosine-specific restriction endonuclease McrA
MANIKIPKPKPWNNKSGQMPWNSHDESGKPFANAKRKNHWFYQSLSWKKARHEYIRLHPMCEAHEKKGLLTIKGYYVDHIDPLGSLECTYDAINKACDQKNLQTLCKSCHASKTNKEIANNKKQ